MLFVVAYHTGLGWVPAGFLGVDIFFVVSGFLITRIVVRDVDTGTFRFKKFYYNRAKRILPAAYVTLLLTIVAAGALLTKSQLAEFRDQVIGSVLFTANVVLWDQTGYFAREAWQKPLLHMWSLAIEEQYYLLMPLAVYLLRGWLRTGAIALATILSLALCAVFVLRNPAATFFLLPTRGWELGIGSLGAFASGHVLVRRWADRLIWPALAVAVLVPFIHSDLPHPGPSALLVCVATVIIILAESPLLNRRTSLRPLVWIGNFSYSLYLVHWPLFAFARVIYMERDLPNGVLAALTAASFAIAYAMYRFVETPFRFTPSPRGRRLICCLVAAGLVLVGLPTALVWSRGHRDEHILDQVRGFKGCLKEGAPSAAVGCSQSDNPEILVWGDSFGAQIIPGLDVLTDHPIEQQTRAMCGSLADFTDRVGLAERTKANKCLKWNTDVLRYVAARPSVRVVVLTSRYNRFLNPDADIVTSAGVADISPADRLAAVTDAILATAERLRQLGKRVVVIAPPPASRFDQGLCWERKSQHLLTLGPFASCQLEPAVRGELEAETLAMLSNVDRGGTPVIFLDRGMCRGGRCISEVDGRPLYRDTGHLTALGSLYAAKSNGLGQEIWRRAR